MSTLYYRIEKLCKAAGITITTMCKASGASRASLSDLKVGRKQSLSADTLAKIAAFFKVSVDFLLGNESSEWCERFRSQLSTILAESNREDMIAAGIDIDALWRIAEGETSLSFDRACDIADALGVSIDFMLGKEKAPTGFGERKDVLDEVDIAWYGDYKELDEDQKATVRDMIRVMRERRAKRQE